MEQDTLIWGMFPILMMVVLSVPIAGLIALAAYKMRRLELYGLAVAASVLAMLPCHPGFIIGLPIGLWSLMVLSRPEVKAAFRQQ
jgi:hypothetical protein